MNSPRPLFVRLRAATLSLAFLALLATSGAAQGVDFTQITIEPGAVGDCKALGDIDGDGLLDVVLGGKRNLTPLTWFRNNGGGSWAKTVIAQPDDEFTTDMQMGDVDADGDIDIVVPDGGTGAVRWYENPRLPGNGDPFVGSNWAPHSIGSPGSWTHDVELGDLDGDGKLDVAVHRSLNPSIIIYYQSSPTVWTSRDLASVVGVAGEGLGIGDVDADGDPDLVSQGFWLRNPGTRNGSWTKHVITTDASYSNGEVTGVVADVDGNGRADVAFARLHQAGKLAWYDASDPVNGPWTEHVISTNAGAHKLNVADMDGDGDLDFVAGLERVEVAVFYNQGGGASWSAKQDLSSHGTHNARVADIDNDGDMDIIGANYADTPAPMDGLRLWRNNSGPYLLGLDNWSYVQVDSSRQTESLTRAFGLGMKDLTGDSLQDLVSGRYFYRNPGGSMASTWPRVEFPRNGSNAVVDAMGTVNIDNDAFGDVIAQRLPDLYWLEASDAQGNNWALRTVATGFAPTEHINSQGFRIADIEPGGKPEIIFTTGAGIWWVRIPADPTQTWPKYQVNAAAIEDALAVGDLDGDGDLDVVAGPDGSGVSGVTVSWWQNGGTPSSGTSNWTRRDLGSIPSWFDRVEVADLNKDGKPDVIATNENGSASGSVTVWFQNPGNPGSSGSWTPRTIVTQGSTNSLDVADMDRDGDNDVITGEHKGNLEVAVWENNGSGTTWTKHLVSSGRESHLGARVGDLDGDGDKEIVSIAYDAFQNLHLWRNGAIDGGSTPAVAAPAIAPNGGTFVGSAIVTLSCTTSGAQIRYTTDGSLPTSSSMLYSSPFSLSSSATVKARGFKSGMTDSPVTSASFTIYSGSGAVVVTDGVMDEGQECYKIETPRATYYYHKVGAGFSSLVDNDGHDWVGFHPAAGSGFSGEYRGIPNLGDCCHPGFPIPSEGIAMTSTLVENTGNHAKIRSISANSAFEVTWDFYPDYATLTVIAMPGNYWFLYEGTPGGNLGSEDYWVRSSGANMSIASSFDADLPSPEWVYFVDGTLGRSLFLARHEDDSFVEEYWNGGAMTVWGFARDGGAPSFRPALPAKLSIGIVNSSDHGVVSTAVSSALAGEQPDTVPPAAPSNLEAGAQ